MFWAIVAAVVVVAVITHKSPAGGELRGVSGGALTRQVILHGVNGEGFTVYFFADGSRRVVMPPADFFVSDAHPDTVLKVLKGTPEQVRAALINAGE